MSRNPAPRSAPAKQRSYAEKRDFARTPEPKGRSAAGESSKPIFVVQKHAARRLHWDFRLEHGGVLWSWAVPKGPSMDPNDKRLAVHVEDHPVDYAGFEGTIPAGNYGAGTVEIWDQGHWTPHGSDPAADLQNGELKFDLDGSRLQGGFVLVRLKPKPGDKADNWLLIKEHDPVQAAGADALSLEKQPGPKKGEPKKKAPAKGANPAPLDQAPQLATLVSVAPTGPGWISEIKFDGYRMLCHKQGGAVRLISRNGLDWTERAPELAQAVAALPAESAVLDGELVSLGKDGRSSFPALQNALSNHRTRSLSYYAFDLLHENGTDLRPLPLRARKQALEALLHAAPQAGPIRISEHLTSETARVRSEACKAGLEGIVCKRLDAPYRAGRGPDWLKLKCENREEFAIVGMTPPKGSRSHFGSLLVARYDEEGALRFAGGVGTGFSAATLRSLSEKLERLVCKGKPRGLVNAETAPKDASWVRPDLVAEIRFAEITPDGMVRQGSFLGLREDKPAAEVVIAVPKKAQGLTHPDRLLWPEEHVSKADLAAYWEAVSGIALPGIEQRPLAFVRCPDGITGEHFFQKHKTRGMPDAIREGAFDAAPYLALSGPEGLAAAAQVAAIELHSWGSTEADPGHADRLVFDLDPGEGTTFSEVIAAATDVRDRLKALGLVPYVRTSGGKGLHVVTPIATSADWDAIRAWCRRFAERMERDAPERYVSTTRKTRRTGRILVDWLRNGLGSTAVASYSPRARAGATVATPLSWNEVKEGLDPGAFTIRTVPARVRKTDPWKKFDADRRRFDPHEKE